MYRMAHVLIRVDGLSADDTKTLVMEFLKAKSLPSSTVEEKDIMRLTEITQNNPKAILVLLGLVEQGMSLSQLLDTITSGKTDADHVYSLIIDYTWKEILSKNEKALLMAKAFFSHSVSEADLGQTAGVNGKNLHSAVKTLASISFFEPQEPGQQKIRIRTHALAQEFAKRVFTDYPDLKKEIEERWWKGYGPNVIKKARQTPYESLQPELQIDVANVFEHIEHHIQLRSPYYQQALTLFGEKKGLGKILLSWSQLDGILRIAESIKEIIINEENVALIVTCCMHSIIPAYIYLGMIDEAERWIGLLVEQNSKLHNRNLEAAIELAHGFIYSYHGYILAEEQAYQKALTIFQELGSVTNILMMYKKLGSLYICLAGQDLEEAFDTTGKIKTKLEKAEYYFKQAEILWQKEIQDKNVSNVPLEYWGQRGIILRLLGGDLDKARDLMKRSIKHANWSSSVANFYRELALLEHLAGNIDLAHSYEKKGTTLLQQLGLLNFTKNSIFNHSRKIIDRMKKEGTW
jgi:tetratricopeptide (TPR) repeat protein